MKHDPELVIGDPDALPQLVVLVLDPGQAGVEELLSDLRQTDSFALESLAQKTDLLVQAGQLVLENQEQSALSFD